VDSLKYLQKNKHLKIHAYVFMLNHIHLIIQSPDVSGAIRDFKSYTAKELLKNIKETEPSILELFRLQNGSYDFWQKTNMPELIETDYFLQQKLDYIHQNPVRKQYVSQPDHWIWSSAGYYENEEGGMIKIDPLDI
jgi:REP element-mobilizing transposase RayT